MSVADRGSPGAMPPGIPAQPVGPPQSGRQRPLPVEGEAWIVTRGRVELYYRDGDASAGRRRFLCELEAGELVPPLGTAARGLHLELLLLGDAAEVQRVAPADLAAWLGRCPSERGDALLARWLARIAARLSTATAPPGQRWLPPDNVVALPAGEAVHPTDSLCWVASVSGVCRVLGRAELALSGEDIVPLSSTLWLAADGTTPTVRTFSTASLPSGCDALDTLCRFTLRLLAIIVAQDRAQTQFEAERVRASHDRDAERLETSYAVLREVLDGARPAAIPLATGDRTSPLLRACRLVGAELGIAMREPPAADRDRVELRDPVERLAVASHVRVRKVILRGAWWKRDGGPLLAFVEDDGRPVALLQPRPSRYTLHDPATRSRTGVTAEVARALRPAAYMFFPSFGDKPLTRSTLWKTGLRGGGWDLQSILLLSAATGLLALASPYLSKILFDDIVPQASRAQLPVLGAVLIVVTGVAGLFGLIRAFLVLRVEARVELNLQASLMDRLLRLPASFFRRFLAGDLAQRVLGIAAIRAAITGSVATAILSGVFSIVSLGLVLYYDARLAALALGLAVMALCVIVASSLVALRHDRHVAARAGEISGLLLQVLTSVAKLRTAGAEARAFAVWVRKYAEQRRHAYRAGAVQNGFQVFTSAYPLLTSMLFFGVIFWITERSAGGAPGISTGTFIAVIAAFGQVLAGMLGLGGALISILQVVPHYERMQPILQAVPETAGGGADPGRLGGAIEISNVTFRYAEDAPVVLNEVSLKACPGEMVALVGPSGSGKSTLVRLLLGFERPAFGTILYDGRDLASLDVHAVRQQIGVVLQHDKLVSGSILDNIIGPWDLSLDDAWATARMVGLEEDIRAMPMEMHTLVSEDGGMFSGGQRQRLLIARALVHRPALLMLDEATSALDNRTQQVVSDSLKRLRVTRFVIAHRLSTIMQADRIYVLDGGRVVETGTYESLVAQGGTFATLAERQLA